MQLEGDHYQLQELTLFQEKYTISHVVGLNKDQSGLKAQKL